MSAEREPASRDREWDLLAYYLLACAGIGALGSVGEILALSARHFMAYTNLIGSGAIGFAGPVTGLAVGVLSFTAGGKRK